MSAPIKIYPPHSRAVKVPNTASLELPSRVIRWIEIEAGKELVKVWNGQKEIPRLEEQIEKEFFLRLNKRSEYLSPLPFEFVID